MIEKLAPNRVRRTYLGGSNINAFTGFFADTSDGLPRPEDWTASVTRAFNGAVEIEGEGLGATVSGKLIKDIAGENLPILVKLLDSDERLVVQAHPTVEYAKRLLNSDFGKTECWYFLTCTEDACVYLGFKKGITKQAFVEAFHSRDGEKILSLLHKIPVKQGDFVFVDGGVPHAIGKGCFMVELQEPSDLMVVAEHITPSGRILPEAKLHMGLGFEEMFNVYDYTGYDLDTIKEKYCPEPIKVKEGVYEIVSKRLTEKFSMYRLSGDATLELPKSRQNAVIVVTKGSGAVTTPSDCISISKGDRLFSSGEPTIKLSGNAEAVICF